MQIRSIFPFFPEAKALIVVKPSDTDLDWEILVRSAQGIVNTESPQIYVEATPHDTHWRTFYEQHYGFTVEKTLTDREFLQAFSAAFKGYTLTDPRVIQTTNLAATLAGLEHWLPVHPRHEALIKKTGLPLKQDFRGKFADDVQAAAWAVDNLLPHCTRKMMATQCVHRDYWVAKGQKLRDYLVYNRVFQIDLGTNRKHLAERDLHYKILAAMEPPAVQLGWHCVRDQEKEWIAEAAQKGVFSLCTTGSGNLTIHGAVPQQKADYSQNHINPKSVSVDQDKVYVTFYLTDGDAIWAMQNLQSDNWLHPNRGEMPFGWGFLPSLWFMAPGILEYYYSTKKSGDYFISPSSGAGYTYSHMLPNSELYLKESWELMQHTAQICGNMVNWNTYEWWREVENDPAIEREQKLLAGAPGLVCGLGGSPYAKSYPHGRCPKVHSVFIANSGMDNSIDIMNLVNEIPNRPLFLFLFVQINRGSFDAVWQDYQKLKMQPQIEIVNMDAFMHGLKKAADRNWVKPNLYDQTPALRDRHLVQPGIANFNIAARMLLELHEVINLKQPERLERLDKGGWQELAAREATTMGKDWNAFLNHFEKGGLVRPEEESNAAAYFAFYVVWALMRGAILSRGIYANNRKKCLEDFEKEFAASLPIAPFRKLWKVWENWETAPHSIELVRGILADIKAHLPALQAVVTSE
ncbi:hypothetical protein JXJ21_19005 [candidate division KSB1 bacterium]|nr:hypothetical protein [candidate division KSB1 bacterium]